MGKIKVNIIVLHHDTQQFETIFKNIELDVEEMSNKKMNQAFEIQHPKLFAKIPTWTEKINGITFTFVSNFECDVIFSP